MNDVQVNIDELYNDAIDFLDENYAFFVTNVLNAGKPIWSHMIETAAVTIPKAEAEKAKKGYFEFIFNPDFAASLSDEHLAFVLAHETMHVLLYHLSMSMNFLDKDIFNIAADCVINDYLMSAGLDAPENLCLGESVVGFNCSNSTVTEVYNVIENDPELQKQLGLSEDCDSCDGTGDGDADCGGCGGEGEDEDGNDHGACGGSGKEACPDCKGSGKKPGKGKFMVIDDHGWMHDPQAVRDFVDAMAEGGFTPENLPDDLEELLNETINEYEKTKMAGKGESSKDEFMKEQKVTLKWLELLEKVDPDMFHKPGAGPKPVTSFRRPRRKLAGMFEFSDAILPSSETPEEGKLSNKSDKKPAIVLALDTSGSIGTATANKFVNLARSIPQDKVEVFACTFTDSYRKLDLDDPKWRSGGTNFSAIEQFIRADVNPHLDGTYPKAVVVVTDGYASFNYNMEPTKEQAQNWSWLLLDNYQKSNAISALSRYGFPRENYDTLDGYVDGNVSWR